MVLPSENQVAQRMEKRLMACAVGVAAVAASIGGFYLVSWLSGSMTYRGLNFFTIKTNASLCILLCSIALIIAIPRPTGNLNAWCGRGLALLSAAISGLSLLEHLLDVDFGIDQFIATEAAGAMGVLHPNRMGPPGALGLTVCSVGIILLLGRKSRAGAVQGMGFATCLIASLGLLGHLYQVEGLYAVPHLGIAFPTSLAVFLLGSGLLLARPREAVMATFTESSPSGTATRRLLIPAVVLPIVLGWLRLQGEMRGWYGVSLGTSMLVLSYIVIFSSLVYEIGKRAEAQQKTVEEQLAQRGLAESERKLRDIIDHLTEGLIIIDPASGALHWNRRALWKHQYEAEGAGLTSMEALAESYEFATLDGDVLSLERWPVKRVLKGEELHDVDLVVTDRKRQWQRIFSYSGILIRDAGGAPQMGLLTFRDITARRKAEEAVRRSEALVKTVLESLPVGVFLLDATGAVQQANKAARDIWQGEPQVGTQEFKLRKGWWADTGRPLGIEEWGSARAIGKGEISLNEEVEIESFEGTRKVILSSSVPLKDERGTIIGAITVNQDITVRKHAENALRESEEKFRAVFQQAAVGMGRVSFDDARWVEVNDAFCRMLGYSREEMLSMPWPQMTHPDDLDLDLVPFREMAAGRLESYSVEKRFFHKDGHVVWARLTLSLVRNLQGGPDYEVAIVEDIADRKEAEEALRKAKEELEMRVRERTAELEAAYVSLQQATEQRLAAVEDLREKEQLLIQQTRLAAMGEMLGNIAHQWRQPLNILSLLIQQLQLTYDLGAFTGDFLKGEVAKGMDVIKHMSQTINDFKDFLKEEKESKQFGVNAAVLATISLLDAPLKALSVEVVVEQRDQLSVTGHRNEFSHVIMNLITNARDAFRERSVAAPRIAIALFREDGKAVVTVSDNAGGIPQEIIGRIFEAYFTTKGPEKGTGIGLYMSKNIIEKSMGGRLTVRNIDGGAEFRIEFDERRG